MQMQKLLTFLFSKNISECAICNDQSLDDTLTIDIVSFEKTGPGLLFCCVSGSILHVCSTIIGGDLPACCFA